MFDIFENARNTPQDERAEKSKQNDRQSRYEKENVHFEKFGHMLYSSLKSSISFSPICYAVGMDKNKTESTSLLVLLIGISILLFFVFAPFLIVLSLAAVFAILLHSPYERLTRFFGGWKSASALLTVGLTLLFFIVPLFFFGVQVFQEAQNLYNGMHGNEVQYMNIVQSSIENPVRNLFPGFVFDINTYVGNALAFI